MNDNFTYLIVPHGHSNFSHSKLCFGAEIHVEKNEGLNCSFGNALFCNANYAVDVCANASESNYK